MAEPKRKSTLLDLIRQLNANGRKATMPKPQTVSEPDAINETLKAGKKRPEKATVKQNSQQSYSQRVKDQVRDNYRRKMNEQQPLSGWLVASDERIDKAIEQEKAQEEFLSRQPQLQQGTNRARVNSDKLADQYSAVSNFYASMGSPNVMPMSNTQVKTNPQRAQIGLNYGLNNPGMWTMQTAAGTLLGGNIITSNAAKTAVNAAGRAMLPSEWITGAAQYFPRFAPYAQTVGQLGNATVASMLAVPGAQKVVEGVGNRDWNQVAHGATDVAFAVPYVQELKPVTKALSPVITVTAPATKAEQVVDQVVFSPTARTTATAAAITTPMVATASDVQQVNPEASWYESMWNTVRKHPPDTALAIWLATKGYKGVRNRYFKEPAGRPKPFDEPAPIRGKGQLYEPYEPSMVREPNIDDYFPGPPKTFEFTEPVPPLPQGPRPKGGKKAKEWDRQQKALSDWEARKDAHYQAQKEALDAYKPEDYNTVMERFNRDYDNWEANKQRWYEEDMARYRQEKAAYDAEQAQLDTDYAAAMKSWNEKKAKYEASVRDYEGSEAYKKWLARRQNWRNKGQWAKDNWLGLGLSGWVVGSHLWGDNPSTPTNNPNGDDSNPANSTVVLPAGFRPVQGVNYETRQIVVPSVTGDPDSTITIEPLAQKRFGRGDNQDKK